MIGMEQQQSQVQNNNTNLKWCKNNQSLKSS